MDLCLEIWRARALVFLVMLIDKVNGCWFASGKKDSRIKYEQILRLC